MKTILAFLFTVILSLPLATSASAWDWVVKDKKGFPQTYVTETKDKIIYKDKKGFLTGSYNKDTQTFKDKKGFTVGSKSYAPGKGPTKR